MLKSHLQRDWAQVKPTLRDILRDLAAGRKPWPLYLHGLPGRGKTCAALCMFDRIDRSLYFTLEQLALHAEDERSWIWFGSARAPLVVVDEIGIRTEEGKDVEYLALTRMYDCREKRPTIWISNLTPAQLMTRYDLRIQSRLTSGTVVELQDTDRRKGGGIGS